jgi:hypothetical protein
VKKAPKALPAFLHITCCSPADFQGQTQKIITVVPRALKPRNLFILSSYTTKQCSASISTNTAKENNRFKIVHYLIQVGRICNLFQSITRGHGKDLVYNCIQYYKVYRIGTMKFSGKFLIKYTPRTETECFPYQRSNFSDSVLWGEMRLAGHGKTSEIFFY